MLLREYQRLVTALKNLGYEDPLPETRYVESSLTRFEIILNGNYIGIWDTDRETFVD
jgi:hypothetical protein